jgi:hypothetical protein
VTDSVPKDDADTSGRPARFIDGLLTSPFSGIAPWILLSVLAAPGRFEVAVAAALGLMLLLMGLGRLRGFKVHSLQVVGAAYFAGLAVFGLLAPDNVIRWLDDWSGVLSNIVLTLFVAGTLIVRRPFSLSYAKETTPLEYWDSTVFIRINYVISAVWGCAFAVSAIAGVVGGLVLHHSGNMWTGWIAPLAAMFFANAVTEVYPDRVAAKLPDAEEPAPPIAKIFEWIPGFVLVVGIVGLIADAVPFAAGVALIVAGAAGSAVMRRILPPEPNVATTGTQSG